MTAALRRALAAASLAMLAPLALLTAACEHKPEGHEPPHETPIAPARSTPDDAALVRGALPAGREMEMVQSRCLLCHSLEYVTQQRLTEAQWEKTLAKMQRWGAPMSDDDRKVLVPYLASTWRRELPPSVPPRVRTPPGAAPARQP